MAAHRACSWTSLCARLLLCTDPDLPATEVVTSYAKRWSVEIVFTQMTKLHPLAGRTARDGVADLDLAVGDQHAVDQQLHELPLAREVGAGQARPDPPAEVRGRGRPAGELGPPVHLRLQLVGLPEFAVCGHIWAAEAASGL